MKYFLQGVEKNRTGLPENLRYFRIYFKSLKTRQLITFNWQEKGKTAQEVLFKEMLRETV